MSKARAYYNEFDPYAAEWLRNLIAAGHIAPGDVDDRSIEDVCADDLTSYTQCHFFAGIGGWSYALRLAGWPDDRPVWTGSCPCQPFSAAGKGKGVDDDRHLWPVMRWLIDQCRPATVFGEQVASRLGRDWLTGVRADLEAMGYAVAAADLCAAGVGAPHIRQRLWWVADSTSSRLERHAGDEPDGNEPGRINPDEAGFAPPQGGDSWADCIWLPCADGRQRRIEPGLEPLAHGIPNRVGRLRAYGNAIVPQVAAAFVRAALEGKQMHYAKEGKASFQ